MVGGTLGIFGWGCAAGTLELLAHTRASSAEFCYLSCIPLTLALLRQRLYRVRGTPETIARILQPYNIRVAHKPITTLRRLPTNVKDKDKPEDRRGAVYKIK